MADRSHILIVEDDEFKRQAVHDLLQSVIDAKIIDVDSVRTAIDFLRENDCSLIVLDMSLPTFSIRGREAGGTPLGFGGLEVLQNLDRFGKMIPCVILSQYSAFSQGDKNISLKGIGDEMMSGYSDLVKSVIYFDLIGGGVEGAFGDNGDFNYWRRGQ